MENKWIDRCMMCLEVLMNFLVIFCLETVIFGSFPDLEKISAIMLPRITQDIKLGR